MLWDKEKTYSTNTSNGCLNSCSDDQDFGTGLVGVFSGVGTHGASGIFGYPSPALTQAPPVLLPLFCWGYLGISEVVVRSRGGAGSCDAKVFSQSCSALSSINDESKSPPGFHRVGIGDRGHLHDGLMLTPKFSSLKKGFAKSLGKAHQFAGGELGSTIFSLLETLK